MPDYAATLTRVETYFDRTATRTWERLTSDAPVSRIRQTVREGRTLMRALMLGRLPADLRGCRVLDAGCGPGMMVADLAARGASVVGVDISPQLIAIAEARLDPAHRAKVRLVAGDMTDPELGHFDAVLGMDSLIYYAEADLAAAVERLMARTSHLVFTVAPRSPSLMAMWWTGKLLPRSDRSPVMVPHAAARLAARVPGLATVGRVSSGFYISECLEVRR
ncbi:MAG: magnesium protoporphyrin IX methyltransferase [Gemmobacter sp.]